MIGARVKSAFSAALVSLLVGCSSSPGLISGGGDSAPARRLDPSAIADAVPQIEPLSRYGNMRSYVVRGKRYSVMQSSRGYREQGVASWYGTKFHGRRTSSGEPYDMYAMTAAHKSLPLPTYVRVRNLRNGRSIVVKVNDRGPFHDNRIIDLSYAAATKLGILGTGTGLVEVAALDPRLAAMKQPAVSAIPAKEKSAAPPAAKSPDLFIQVGAFSNRSNADRLRQRLQRELEPPVRIQQSRQAGLEMFRVRVGPLNDVDQSDAVTRRLAQLGIEDSHIIIE
ncbi:MAG: septal ring lytic transglycosylase RlpA family protein [Gammaproteobacteria bacterium]|nr:septal ring lytic transglycosylase RlpA family protein [Gammaproteobacteria bacterium]